MENLYIITNILNNKKYVGKTNYSLEKRWATHIRDSRIHRDRPLYRAINKYGSEYFKIELVGQYPSEQICEEETKLIQKLNTYKNGYNATLGGEGRKRINHSDRLICKTYYLKGSSSEAAKILKISRDSVLNTLHKYNLPILNLNRSTSRPIILATENKYFESIKECVKYLKDSKIIEKEIKDTSAIESIRKVLNGRLKSYKKLKFKYAD